MLKIPTCTTALSLGIIFLLCDQKAAFSQVYTFDYLTYSDYAWSDSKAKLTSYIFNGRNEFDNLGKTSSSSNTSYEEVYLYGAFKIYKRTRVELNVAWQTGLLLSEGTSGRMFGTPWIWTKFKVFEKAPVTARLGFEWGQFGNAFWIDDNELDIGLLAHQSFHSWILDASLSYRIKGKDEGVVLDYGGLFDQAGNQIHYKFETSRKLNAKLRLALLGLGYHSGNKKLNGAILPDSYSRKTAVGFNFWFKPGARQTFALGLLWDTHGRYDKKGFSFVFNVTE